MTARQALAVLVAEGLAVARKGSGVFVREFRPIISERIERVAADVWQSGRSVWGAETEGRSLDVDVDVSEIDAPEDVAAALDTAAPARVVARSRCFLLDGKPVALATSYLPAEIVAGSRITQPDTGPGGTYARLGELGHAPTRFREDVRARMPDREEAERLQLDAGTPVVTVARTAYAGDRPVELNVMTFDAGVYVLRYDFRA